MPADHAVCRRIVGQAIYAIRGRSIGTLDADDIAQELMDVAIRAAEHPRNDGRAGTGYVRASVKNRVRDLYAYTFAVKRHPSDGYGRPVAFANPDVLAWEVSDTNDPEQSLIARECILAALERLPVAEWITVRQWLAGKRQLTEQDADHITYLLTEGSGS